MCQVINFMLKYIIGEKDEEDAHWFHCAPYIWCHR